MHLTRQVLYFLLFNYFCSKKFTVICKPTTVVAGDKGGVMFFLSRPMVRGWILALVALISLSSCSQSKVEISKPEASQDIFSDRPLAPVPDLFVLTLTSPALLKVAHKSRQGLVIPENAKNAVLKEQSEFQKKLKDISPDIQIIYNYRYTLNGLAIFAPAEAIPQIQRLRGLINLAPAQAMSRPSTTPLAARTQLGSGQINSVSFIGTRSAHNLGFKGQGMRVGVIDTGVDYTHAMLGGSGKPEDFKAIDPSLPSNQFPNLKVVGGKDFVGRDFNTASALIHNRIPHPDDNPIDEAGHGTHVAGTIAGMGDGVNSYTGVAPDALIYAIKVFGEGGSTMDAAVIAGLDYAADPNGDFNLDDQLHVVNLSLGGGFGQPQILYSEAVKNLSDAGTVVVASAGNSGGIDYIVGAPGTATEAISIAASIDGSPHNWQSTAVRFITPTNSSWMIKATEGPISKPIAEIDPTEGELVDIGLADEDLNDMTKVNLQGKVALIMRGKVSFLAKLRRAEAAGAIGAVVYNNEPGKPIAMGGEGQVNIPAIMVSQALGLRIKDEMNRGSVRIQFKTDETIEEPDLVDQITDFSSKGPRSEDNLIKPEIAAPGKSITSAAMGQGTGTVKLDGTSMAAPHMAGAMALLKQKFPNLASSELKAIAMNTAKILSKQGTPIPISLQGAGRIQIDQAIEAQAFAEPAALSLGRLQVGHPYRETRSLKIQNLTNEPLLLNISSESDSGLIFTAPPYISVPPNGRVEVSVTIEIQRNSEIPLARELNGRLIFKRGSSTILQVPALTLSTQTSEITAELLKEKIRFTNSSPIRGQAFAFNLLGTDARKVEPPTHQAWKARSCDLQSAGYRIIEKQGQPVMQFGFKLHTPMTTWHLCEVSVLIDANGDGIAEQELAGVSGLSFGGQTLSFASILLDAAQARSIRADYEKNLADGKDQPPNYGPAILNGTDMTPFNQSTIAIIEAPLTALSKTSDGKLRIKLATIGGGGDMIESDDYLGDGLGEWLTIPSGIKDQPAWFQDESTEVTSRGASLSFTRGNFPGQIVILYPHNSMVSGADSQMQILQP